MLIPNNILYKRSDVSPSVVSSIVALTPSCPPPTSKKLSAPANISSIDKACTFVGYITIRNRVKIHTKIMIFFIYFLLPFLSKILIQYFEQFLKDLLFQIT